MATRSVAGAIARHVDEDRVWRRHMELAEFGATGKSGVDRPALSKAEIDARRVLIGWGRAIGLVPSTDDVSNLFLQLVGTEPALPPVLVGSHTDSVPTGGKFDGAFGVLAALECVEAIVASGLRPRRSIEVVAWCNEEGTRFSPSLLGSSVFTGARQLKNLRNNVDKSGISVGQALDEVLAATPDIKRRELGFPVAAYLEAHIEQATVLEKVSIQIGVVSGILAKKTIDVVIEGQENHAATTPHEIRKDALVCAADIVHSLNLAMWDDESRTRFTIGIFEVSPNHPFIIPGRVRFQIDLRHPDPDAMRAFGDTVRRICTQHSGRCKVTVADVNDEPTIGFDARIKEQVSKAARELGIPTMLMPSWAWHDARCLQQVCPTGMIFIPCKNGISHNELESAAPADIAAAARVMAEAVFAIANET